MLFPERDIADKFWTFVRALAIDPRIGIDDGDASDKKLQRQSSRTLERVKEERHRNKVKLAGPHARNKIGLRGTEDEIWRTPYWSERDQYWTEPGEPWGYRTLQEALVAFLIELAARDELTFDFEIWCLTVPVILADAIRDPELIRVILRDLDYADASRAPGATEDNYDDPEFQTEYVMTVSDDWSCLRAKTFGHIIATYTGKG